MELKLCRRMNLLAGPASIILMYLSLSRRKEASSVLLAAVVTFRNRLVLSISEGNYRTRMLGQVFPAAGAAQLAAVHAKRLKSVNDVILSYQGLLSCPHQFFQNRLMN